MRGMVIVLLACGCAAGDDVSVSTGFGGDSSGTIDDGSDCTPGDCDGRPDPDGPARTVHVVWTIERSPPSATTCANSPHYAVELQTDSVGYRPTDMVLYPVPCIEGKLTIADVPARYWIGGAQTSLTGDRAGAAAPFDAATQTATIDMVQW